MFCPNCGSQNNDSATFCASCGTALKPQQAANYGSPAPKPGNGNNEQGAETIVQVLSFCFPIVGLVLYFVWKDDKPKAASQVCKMAAIGFGVGIFFYIVMMVIAAAAGGL